ncbi:MAG: hypothetical protein SF053_06240 [Bacteroidia bacterium]|nr:hypothetical protein [Bacteroidia bacterium]
MKNRRIFITSLLILMTGGLSAQTQPSASPQTMRISINREINGQRTTLDTTLTYTTQAELDAQLKNLGLPAARTSRMMNVPASGSKQIIESQVRKDTIIQPMQGQSGEKVIKVGDMDMEVIIQPGGREIQIKGMPGGEDEVIMIRPDNQQEVRVMEWSQQAATAEPARPGEKRVMVFVEESGDSLHLEGAKSEKIRVNVTQPAGKDSIQVMTWVSAGNTGSAAWEKVLADSVIRRRLRELNISPEELKPRAPRMVQTEEVEVRMMSRSVQAMTLEPADYDKLRAGGLYKPNQQDKLTLTQFTCQPAPASDKYLIRLSTGKPGEIICNLVHADLTPAETLTVTGGEQPCEIQVSLAAGQEYYLIITQGQKTASRKIKVE